jgi:hypothetical protein
MTYSELTKYEQIKVVRKKKKDIDSVLEYLHENYLTINKLPDNIHKVIGNWSQKKWYPKPTYVVPGSFEGFEASVSFPYAYITHVYTKKYFRLLLTYKPESFSKLLVYQIPNCPEYILIRQRGKWYKTWHQKNGKKLQKHFKEKGII